MNILQEVFKMEKNTNLELLHAIKQELENGLKQNKLLKQEPLIVRFFYYLVLNIINLYYIKKGAPKSFGFINGNKEITVKAGDPLRILVPFSSSPRPKVSWLKLGEELREDERIKFETNKNEAELIALKAITKDAGSYSCTLRNDLGQERVNIKVIVIDKPSQPQGPIIVSDIKADGCTLTWKPPHVSFKI